MKKEILLCSLLSVFFTFSIFAQTFNYSFEKPVIKQVDESYSILLYENCLNMGDPGTPEIPLKGINILIPQNHEVTSVEIVSVSYYPVEEGIDIKPAVEPVPLSLYDGSKVVFTEDKTIYNSEEAYPARIIDNEETHYLSGHSIASFTLCPVVYYPALHQVKTIKEISVRVNTSGSQRGREASRFLNNSARIQNKVKGIVENPERLFSYSYPSGRDGDPCDILIISNQTLMPGFEDYIEYKVETGYLVETITVEEITNTYTGQDEQEKIRNCIIDYYTNSGIEYVILGGDGDMGNPDDNIIPPRGFIADSDDDIAADMYYANLDGTWNDDNDNLWGEPGEWDLYSEVSIGRICVDDPVELENALEKILLYQSSPVEADIEKGLLVGESLNSYTWGGTYKDEIETGSSNNGYTTVGFPPNFNIDKLYEMLEMWDKTDIYNQFNVQGVNLLNHLGHSNVTYNMKMYNSDLTTNNFTNDGITRGYVIGYSQGCYNGSFDNRSTGGSYGNDCFAETFAALETGEVASIANSRYGWYNPGGTNSSSQYYDRLFFDVLFGDNVSLIGDAHAAAKEKDVSYMINNSNWRWVAYELNLFGDPTMDIWTETPTDIVADYPVSIPIGSSSLTVSTDAPFARIGLTHQGELIGRGVADESGNATITFPMITNPAPIDISIIAHNKNHHTGSILVISDQPYIIYAYHQLNDVLGNWNGQIDYGESVYLSLALTNVGDQPSYNTMVTMTTTDEKITVTDGSHNYGVIQAGQTVNVPDAFAFEVANDINDEHEFTFDFEISGEDIWYAEIELEAYAPYLKIGEIIIDDTAGGNGNGNIDPGESMTLYVKSINAGHSDCFEATGLLETTSPHITISEPSVTIGDMPFDTVIYVPYEIEVDDYAPIGDYVDLQYTLNSGEYTTDFEFIYTIGLIFEDWESGDFSKFAWSSSSTWPWGMAYTGAFEGSYAVCSGDIGNEETSNIMLTYNCVASDSISFFRKISSEEEADYLRFYIDGVLIDEWAGMFDWEKFTYPVIAGVHTFMWQYEKNEEEKKGEDCAWIDYIVFPPTKVTHCYPGNDTSVCNGDTYQCEAIADNYTSLEWNTSGTGTFDDPTILSPVYTPSEEDYEEGSVVLELTAYSSLPCGDISRDFTLSFDPLPSIPEIPEGPDYVDLYYNTTSDYSINPAPDADSYSWALEPEEAGTITGTDLTGTVEWNLEFLGTAFVKVKGANECGESEYSEAIEVTVNNTVGFDENITDPVVRISPNPSKGVFLVTVKAGSPQSIDIDILNASGFKVYQIKDLAVENEVSKEINLEHLNNGIYYLRIKNNQISTARKIVIMK